MNIIGRLEDVILNYFSAPIRPQSTFATSRELLGIGRWGFSRGRFSRIKPIEAMFSKLWWFAC